MKQSTQTSLKKSVLTNPLNFLSFGFGSGLLPKAPGTWGTLIAIPVWYLLSALSLPYYLMAAALLSIVGVGLCHYTAKKLGVHDHPGIVWDEICGYLVTMIAVPVSWQWALAGFVLFRVFDILKPWPIKWLDKKVHGGFGIMVDDLLAGGFALAILHIAILLL
ncbi:phosphatidylglycerophosphatase A family protein [Kangiella sediminilitoris]|uniref:Phosphatidylglycerophosphatase A n=1 Tax=Kangiella sediminilitoris TaxID=1144748 RepID=A0A1B3BCV3_9GAMM|nr:phosphatidylglycerophosphatase A [Kangiella sediminilitoris]AOE50654.1 phosphatidylglycerophosphatase [Kangiella sediminilitoris]